MNSYASKRGLAAYDHWIFITWNFVHWTEVATIRDDILNVMRAYARK